jgi:two-component system cit operon sensor histidine kinase CitA
MDKPFQPLLEAELISIIGNLLDNAIEATQRRRFRTRRWRC